MKKYIAYYRVSTRQQGRSGLGLDAQRTAVTKFTNNCADCVLAEFTDVETGKNNQRTELIKAIAEAKKQGAQLLIAKLDRLSRNVGFIFQLRDSGVDFVCCDMPQANTLTIGMFATLAQYERELISERTKAALRSKKAAGYQLGNPQGFTAAAQAKATRTKRQNAQQNKNSRQAKQMIKEMIQLAQFQNISLTIRIVAERLNQYNLKTATGQAFTPENVRYFIKPVLADMNLKQLPKAG